MASVDFSSAVLEVNPDYGNDQISLSFLGLVGNLNGNNTYIATNAGGTWTTIATLTVTNVTNTPSKLSYSFTGTFRADGTEFYICSTSNNRPYWKVSNVSFSDGDTFGFVIDIDISVS